MTRYLVSLVALVTVCAAQAFATDARFIDPPRDAAHPARMEVLHIPTAGVEINGVAYIASGQGTHPTLVICHGWPGNEKNLDLAQAVRRAGWNAVTFNYRGSWGSPGEFHFSQVSQDATAVIAWLRKPEVAAKLGVDPRRIAIAGHSMGGWATARVASADSTLLGAILIAPGDMGSLGKLSRPDVVKEAAENAETLVTTPEKMADELIAQSQTFLLANTAPGLAKIPLLVLTADDGAAPRANALVTAVRAQGSTRVQTQHFTTDHSWSDSRLALADSVITWLQGLTK
jgi:pimeloyl-ACP methyl ester carboxylesterase